LSEIVGTLWLLLPLLGAAVLHGWILKYEWFPFLARPIDQGMVFRRQRLFGANKTWRGVAAVAAGCAIVLGLQSEWLHKYAVVREIEPFDYAAVNGWLLGLWVGALAELSELPNSFVKRRYGIAPGETGQSMRGALFRVWDQVDLLPGLWIAYSVVVDVTVQRIMISALVLLIMHPAITFIGYRMGMRKSRR
jgi:hypothetical protein